MTIRRMMCLAGLIWVLQSMPAQASQAGACSGSGAAWSCPAGSSTSDVQSVLNTAPDGATITFAAGSYNWGGMASFSNSSGATLICASVGACNVTASSVVLGIGALSGTTTTHLYRISGFNFNQTGGLATIWFGANCGCSGTSIYTQIRIDHNTFNTSNVDAIFFGENSTLSYFYGVVDHNTLNASSSVGFVMMIGTTNSSIPVPSPLGTASNMFLEDNTVTMATMTDAGQGCVDGWGNNNMVIRHNTSLNCLWTSHGVTHTGGPQNVEFYSNHASVNAGSVGQGVQDGYRLFHHQGSGEFIAFNNTFTAYSGKNSEVIGMMYYRDDPNGIDGSPFPFGTQCNGSFSSAPVIDGNRAPTGYPCWRQPGRDTNGNYVPMYAWNNYWSDTRAQVPLQVNSGSITHMQADRDWYNAVSASAQNNATAPFNGMTGMGFGTLANRPTACTTSSETAFGKGAAGVGYFATDVGPQGTLYTCSAANTWSVFYTPYNYPHPLTAGGSGSPAPPTGLQASVN